MRHKDLEWSMPSGKVGGGGTVHEWQAIYVSLLMDIRDELKALNATCRNTLAIPHTLTRIDKRLMKLEKLRNENSTVQKEPPL